MVNHTVITLGNILIAIVDLKPNKREELRTFIHRLKLDKMHLTQIKHLL